MFERFFTVFIFYFVVIDLIGNAPHFLAACVAMMVAWVNSPKNYLSRPSFTKPAYP